MNLSFNANSWHFKYYSWSIGDTPPKTLCPYFWSMIGITLLMPLVLIFKGIGAFVRYLDKIKSNKPEVERSYEYYDKKHKNEELFSRIFVFIGKLILGFFIGMFLFLIGYLLFSSVNKIGWWEMIKNLLIVIGIIVVIASVVLGIGYIWDKLGLKFLKSKLIQIPKQMVVAVYTKSCPMIEWVGLKPKRSYQDIINEQIKNNEY